jgi:hypothetical protein
MFRSDRLDLKFPRLLKAYDKFGGRLLLRSFKENYLGSTERRLTRKICDQFFANKNNFLPSDRVIDSQRDWSFFDDQPSTELQEHRKSLGASEGFKALVRQE